MHVALQSMSDQIDRSTDATLGTTAMAWFVHALTASGVLIGVAGIYAVLDHNARAAMVLLLVAMIVDGIDGPIARKIQISKLLPQVDGYVLDLIVDYLTCVIVPAIFLHQFHLLPKMWSVPAIGLVLFTSALWFARSDMMTDDHWFAGFPATWNLVAPTMLLLDTPRWVNLGIVVVLSLMSLSRVEFAHPVQVSASRSHAIPMTVLWLVALGTTAIRYGKHPITKVEIALLVVCPLYFGGLTVHRSISKRIAARRAIP